MFPVFCMLQLVLQGSARAQASAWIHHLLGHEWFCGADESAGIRLIPGFRGEMEST